MEMIYTFIWFVVVIYLALYCFNALLLIIMAQKGRLNDLRRKSQHTSVQRHITVIIYAETIVDMLLKLVASLQDQNYPNDKYSINIVLEDDNPNSNKVLGLIDDIKIWRISSNKEKIGFFPSISKIIEKNMASQYTNAFVILKSDNLVKSNFVERVNISLENNNISQACLATTSPYSSFYNSIGYINNRIFNRITNAGRFHLNAGSDILSSGLIVTQEFLEKYPINTDKIKSEVDYNYYLLSEKIKVNWAPEVIIFNKMAEDLKDLCIGKAETTINKLKAAIKNINLNFKNTGCLNYTLYLLCPNKLMLGILSIIAFLSGYIASLTMANTNLWAILPLILMGAIILLDLPAMAVSKCTPKDYKIWLISLLTYLPENIITLFCIIKLWNQDSNNNNLPYLSLKKESLELYIPDSIKEKNIILTDGTKNIQCKVEITTKQNENQIALIFKNKKYTSNKHATMDRCFEEINSKLEKYNFSIINCFNCGYFSFSNQSHQESNGTDGHCFFNKEGQHLQFNDTIKIWHYCDSFCPIENRIEILKNWKNSLPENNNDYHQENSTQEESISN
ncbi:MAG: hypothetical protein AB7V50_07180 [Vampirovibrionia bacterium]